MAIKLGCIFISATAFFAATFINVVVNPSVVTALAFLSGAAFLAHTIIVILEEV